LFNDKNVENESSGTISSLYFKISKWRCSLSQILSSQTYREYITQIIYEC